MNHSATSKKEKNQHNFGELNLRQPDAAGALGQVSNWEGLAVDTKANEFRRNAEDCRQRALHAHNSCDLQHWVEVAAHWTKMALAEEMANCHLSERPALCRANVGVRFRYDRHGTDPGAGG